MAGQFELCAAHDESYAMQSSLNTSICHVSSRAKVTRKKLLTERKATVDLLYLKSSSLDSRWGPITDINGICKSSEVSTP